MVSSLMRIVVEVQKGDENAPAPECNFLQDDNYDELRGTVYPLNRSDSYGMDKKIRSNPNYIFMVIELVD